MKQEQSRFFVVALATIATTLSLALTVQAQQTTTPPTPQTANGAAGVNYSAQSGDNLNAGAVNGGVKGTYNATDPVLAQGNADSAGAGASSQKIGANSASSKANSVASTLVKAIGAQSNVTVQGEAQQGNWMGVTKDSLNNVSAGNTTDGNFSGAETAAAPVTGTGNAQATGKSSGKLTGFGTNNVAFCVQTNGMSNGLSNLVSTDTTAVPTGASAVTGTGSIAGQIVAGNPNGTFANSFVGGGATYSATNPTSSTANGLLKVGGTGNAVVTNPGSVSASASMHSLGTAK